MIYLITVNYYSINLIQNLLASLGKPQSGVSIIVVNNSPEDSTIQTLASSCILLDSHANLGFGRACNLAIQCVYQQDPNALAWLINPDAYFQSFQASLCAKFFEQHPEVSILGTTIYEPDGQLWFGGGEFLRLYGSIAVKDLRSQLQDRDYRPCD
jgi:GT2 family glycosyltransferase